jgi:hypothetical protein
MTEIETASRRCPRPPALRGLLADAGKALSVLLLGAASVAGAAAGTRVQSAFDSAALPAALPGASTAGTAIVVEALAARLPAGMSVIDHGRFVIALTGSRDEALRQGRRIARHDAQMRAHAFPALDARRAIVVLAADPPALAELARRLYPTMAISEMPPDGFYHQKDRLILATTANGEAALWARLMQSLLRDYNPNAPYWFEQAAATLYEASAWRADRLTPLLDDRMRDISASEDLSYDVFAGICDCSPVSAEQLALMRLLLVYLDQHDELKALQAIVKERGKFTTLLEALDVLDFDHAAWKHFAERSVRAYPR